MVNIIWYAAGSSLTAIRVASADRRRAAKWRVEGRESVKLADLAQLAFRNDDLRGTVHIMAQIRRIQFLV